MATNKESTTKKTSKAATLPKKEERPAPRRTTAKPDMELLERSDIPLKAKLAPPTPVKSERRGDPLKDVKLPKIAAKNSIPYNPGYVPMEKRVEVPKPTPPLVKYGDFELNEFRSIINKKMEIAKKELAYLQGLISRKDGIGETEETRFMTMEDGGMSMEREQLSQMASRQISYIDHLEKALMRIENKTYGVCRITGKLIDKARLRAVPHATLSLEAKLGLVKTSGE